MKYTKFIMEVTLENACFDDDMQGQLAGIMRRAANKVNEGYITHTILDANGNSVGSFTIVSEEEGDAQ